MNTTSKTIILSAAILAIGAACGGDSTAPKDNTIRYTATLSPANERQTNADGSARVINSTATGTALVTLKGDTITWTVTANGLTGPATLSHIHACSAACSGGVVLNFAPITSTASGTVASSSMVLSASTAALLIGKDSLIALLNNGNAYVNIHTSTYGAGEIRGNLTKQ